MGDCPSHLRIFSDVDLAWEGTHNGDNTGVSHSADLNVLDLLINVCTTNKQISPKSFNSLVVYTSPTDETATN